MNTFEWTLEMRFGLALALGFLIGLERETAAADRKTSVLAGVRTHSIISLYGFGCAWLFHINLALALPVGMLSIAALALAGYLAKLRYGRIGWTSEVATLMTFIIGVLSLLTDIWVPMALGIITTIMLSEKANVENLVENLDKAEFLAVLKFLLVTVIVLPVLPNQEYTNFKLNPTRIWQIVILVSTIGFVGYFLTKKLGSSVGLWLSGLLGGIVSSTAVSIAAGRMAQKDSSRSGHALQASLLASSVMYLRILVIVWVVNPAILPWLSWKLPILTAIGIGLSIHLATNGWKGDGDGVSSLQNPFELKPAMYFAVVFVVLSIVTMFIRTSFGTTGLYLLSAVVGVTDIDPYILSLIGSSAPVEAFLSTAMLVAMMSNTIAKGVYFAFLAKGVRKETYWRYGIWAVLHLPFILFF